MINRAGQRLVLDTSLFSNPETQQYFGDDIEDAITRFIGLANKNGIELYMPISIFRELSNFTTEEIMSTFRKNASVRAPRLHDIKVPAAIFHSFVNDLRDRVNRGLRIAEEAIRSEENPDNIRWVRRKYRDALRTGIVDSVEDLDVVLLAEEVSGAILSADKGIESMGEELGIEFFTAEDIVNIYGDN